MLALSLSLALAAAAPARPAASPLPPLALETFTLPNGMTVVLHPDRRLPQVVVNTWFGVGSKDEAPGRTGFAHLFEHLMFMGTERVPGNQFDVLMESGGGANNASTSEDRTNYYSFGPTQLLPTLLWLDADRYEALAKAMTEEKVDLQRDVVRNERRQSYENRPYGMAELAVPEAMYPPDHPYHHPVIGSHADLEAASLEDVKRFFEDWYVPGNASLVVAGDFDPAVVRPMVESLFGALPAKAVPPRPAPPLARLDREVRRVLVDEVELPRLVVVWHAPPAYAPGTAELELLASVLADGASSRLDRRLVQELRLAESVEATLQEQTLGSLFLVQVTGVPGADLERLKREVLTAVARLQAEGPSAAELARVKARAETAFREGREQLLWRADRLNEYRFHLGEPDAFARDLARYQGATAAGLRDAARALGEGRLDLRVVPAAPPTAAIPAARPADLPPGKFTPPSPTVFTLANGLEVRAVRTPGTGLFSAQLVLDGGERAVPAEKAGLASVLARLLVSGAAGKDAPAFAESVATLGAEIDARATRNALVLQTTGLAARAAPTLDLFVDALLLPNLAPADFERELALAKARVAARADEPMAVAQVASAAALYGRGDVRGRPIAGYAGTLSTVTLDDVRRLLPRLTRPRGAVLVFAGDLEPAALRALLERRLGAWQPRGEPPPPAAAPVASAPGGRLLLVDRPGAAQTVILAARPAARPDEAARAARGSVNVALGGSFTSRLNQNLREKHGYTYGARSVLLEDGPQTTFAAAASVQTEVTGAALVELRRELDGIAAGLPAPEVAKARETARHRLVEQVQTTGGLAEALAEAALAGRPADALAREASALAAVDAAAADAAARAGPFGFAGLTVVLVGDAKSIRPQLAKAGFPAPEEVDVEGTPSRR